MNINNKKFSSLAIKPEILKALAILGYNRMTAIQAKALPHVLKNKDVIAQAKTGSGKTAVFGIGLLSKLDIEQKNIQGLVLCPTRELADQVGVEIRKLASCTPNVRIVIICGGYAFRLQEKSLANGAHIVVGTPGRILDHIHRGSLELSNSKNLILDEADRMLDMGFQNDIEKIISKIQKKRQTLLFSATITERTKSISHAVQNNPIEISIESTHKENTIKQLFYEVKKHERNKTLLLLLGHYKPKTSIIFCNTKEQCKKTTFFLKDKGIYAIALHGDLDQKCRDQTLIQFANNSYSVLVATDVAARGLDISKIDLVINYELARTAEIHIHRIGRTGRANTLGLAVSLYLTSEIFKIKDIEAHQKTPILCDVPESLDNTPLIVKQPEMATLCISGGKKQKLRAGDILGALTSKNGVSADQVGKINIGDYCSYVAISRNYLQKALYKLKTDQIKNCSFKIKIMS